MIIIPWTTKCAIAAIALVSVASCASPHATASATPNASGTLTIDGKASELRHAYVVRQPPGPEDLGGVVKILVTNEPIPDSLLSRLVTAAKTPYPAYELLGATSIRGLMLVVDKISEIDRRHMFMAYLVADGSIIGPHVDRLATFSAVDGVVTGRAEAEWADKVECAFRVSFEARSAGQFVPDAASGGGSPLKPAAGKASGTLRVKDRTYSVTTAYAVKKRIFYDEPEEMFYVLVGDQPVEGADLLSLLLQDKGHLVERDGYHGLHLKVNQYGNIVTVQALGAHPTSYGEGYGLTRSKELRIENGRVIGSAADRNRDGDCEFSITFDVPITLVLAVSATPAQTRAARFAPDDVAREAQRATVALFDPDKGPGWNNPKAFGIAVRCGGEVVVLAAPAALRAIAPPDAVCLMMFAADARPGVPPPYAVHIVARDGEADLALLRVPALLIERESGIVPLEFAEFLPAAGETLFAFASTGEPRGEAVIVAGGVKLDDFLWTRTETAVARSDAAVVALLDDRGRLAGVATVPSSPTALDSLALPASSLDDHLAAYGIYSSDESVSGSECYGPPGGVPGNVLGTPPPSPASRPTIMRVSGGVLAGKAKQKVEPVYPPKAKAAHIEGAVVVEVTVGETGSVLSARAVSGHPLLRDASVAAARGWTFAPTEIGGTPVKVIGTITFNYKLPKPPGAAGASI